MLAYLQYLQSMYGEPAQTSEQVSAPVSAEPVYTPPVEYSAPPAYTEQLGSPYASEPLYSEQAPISAEPAYNPYVEPAYTEQAGSPYAVEPLPSEQVGMPNAVEPLPSAPVDGMTDPLMGPEDYAITGPRPTVRPTPETVIQYSKPSATPGLDFVTNDGQQGYYFVTNAGKPAKTKANPTAFVNLDPNATYRLVNERGQNVVVTTGTGEQGLRDAYAAAQRLSTEGGTKADWYLERSDPNGQWTRIADDDPKGSDLGVAGKILGAALPIATAFIPGLGPLATIAMQTASGAAGAALAGGDPLKGAVIGGLTAGGGALGASQLAPALNVATKTGSAIGTGLGATAGNLVTGQNLKNSLLGGLASGAASYLIPSVAEELGIELPGTGGQYDKATNTITATGGVNPSTPISAGSGSNVAGDAKADTLGGEIVVSGGNAAPSVNLAPIFAPSPEPIPIPQPLDAATPQQPAAPKESEIIVSGGNATPSIPIPAPIFTPSPEPVPIPQPLDAATPQPPAAPEESQIVVTGGQPVVSAPIGLPAAPPPPPPPSPLDAGLPQQPEAAPENRDIVVTGREVLPSVDLAPIFTPSPQPVPIPQPLDAGAAQQPTDPDQIVVTGNNAPPLPPSVPVTLPITSGGLPPVTYEEGINVLANKPAVTEQPPSPPVSVLPPVDYETGINVIGNKTTVPEQPTSIPVTPPIVPSRIDLGFTGARDGATQPEAKQDTTLKDIADYLRLAGLATSLFGGLAGSGGGGGGQKFNIPGGMGQLNPIFGAKLPPANLPGLGGGSAGSARPPSDLAAQGLSSPIDYYRYGYGPQQSFFNYVPQGAPNTSKAYTGYSEGGYAVEGPGDGRDDQIPALLSDGEYVIDAETVALLGNGSNKAGADMLDAFRVNVRKQKGQKLARGEFSENAKRPEHYMAGGLS
jgi:hypothetical protein